MNNKVYVVLEDVGEAYVFHCEGIMREIFYKEEDAMKYVKEHSMYGNCIYYEEREIK